MPTPKQTAPHATARRTTPRPGRHGLPRPWRAALLVTGLVLVAACQAPPAATAAPARSAEAAEAQTALRAEQDLLARIRAEVGSAACSRDDQCHSLPIGAKPCGGPEAWLPWSSVNARADQLQAWAAELAELQRARNERSGIASNCRYNPDPGALCRQGRCVSGAGQAAR